jgi:Trypsin-like peptidase domain
MQHHGSTPMRDFVFPIALCTRRGNDLDLSAVLGSAFLIGNRGFAITAKHVIEGHPIENLVAMFVDHDGHWIGRNFKATEAHAEEDIALLQLPDVDWISPFRFSRELVNSGLDYHLMGYPEDTRFELVVDGKAIQRPDLVYNRGYIRRRFTGSLPKLHGMSFIELSEVAGSGVSGAPVFAIRNRAYNVIGVYCGEKTNDRSTSVSYATRIESINDWVPELLQISVFDESQNSIR